MVLTRPSFFVRHLPETHPKRTRGNEFELQVLDEVGRAISVTRFGRSDLREVTGAPQVPEKVIEFARRLPPGPGRFVNESGNEILPKDL